ncbi:MAG: hypothetical protein QXL09_02535 [Candidatus Aenigmatarchaeota archaeon]
MESDEKLCYEEWLAAPKLDSNPLPQSWLLTFLSGDVIFKFWGRNNCTR